MTEKNNFAFLTSAFGDLEEDFEEQIYLVDSLLFNLEKFLKEIKNLKNSFRPTLYALFLKEAKTREKKLEKHRHHLTLLKKSTRKKPTISSYQKILEQKKLSFEVIRHQYNQIASLITSPDWQSPSFLHSLFPEAGKMLKKAKATFNDYKRDWHNDALEYEKLYLKEYIEAKIKWGKRALLTNSGQAAFTTILFYLLSCGVRSKKILVGQSSYFQYKQILAQTLQENVIFIEETKTQTIKEIIKKERPKAIFLDSLPNAKNLPVPNLKEIIHFLLKEYREEIYLIIDNTCLSISFQPFSFLPTKNKYLHLILFESLIKYHHFGLDRANGGIIIAQGKDASSLFEYRKHCGTNIADTSVYCYPLPKRKRLEARLKRIKRNLSLLISGLEPWVVFPGLANHPSFAWTRSFSFWGSFFNLSFPKGSIKKYQKFIKIAISEARKEKIELIGGTSFGFNHTRIYLTSFWTKYGQPFLRVAVGTEDRYQIEILKKIFRRAIEKIG